MLQCDQVDHPLDEGESSNLAKRTTRKSAPRFRTSLGLLGVCAIVLGFPVASSASPALGDTVPAARVATTFSSEAEESWANLHSDRTSDAEDLSENPGAASRARLRDPASVRACVAAEGAANGSRTLTSQQVVYEPMVEGSFEVSSLFGGRIDPVFGTWRMHNGDDYSADPGTPIFAVADGVVQDVGSDFSRGYYTEILHEMQDGSTVISAYFHQTAGSQKVAVGDKVKAGQEIGAVGTTGKSTGAHLHFEINDLEGNAVSPSAWLDAHDAVFIGKDCQ